MGSSTETLCLRWTEYESNIKQGFSLLRSNEDFFDVTLGCGSSQIKAHRVVLSACSAFFRSLLKSIPHHHPFLYLKGVQSSHLEAILSFMYNGEVRVKPEELEDFLFSAQELKVNGLMQDAGGPSSSSSVPPKTEPKEELPPPPREGSQPPPPGRLKREFPSQADPTPPNKRVAEDEDSDIEEIHPGQGDDGFQEYAEDPNESMDPTDATPNNDVSRDQLLDAELMKYVSPKGNNSIYNCLKCSYNSVNRLNVKKHVEARHFVTDGFKCEKCGRVFKTRETLSKHYTKVHKGESVYFSTAS